MNRFCCVPQQIMVPIADPIRLSFTGTLVLFVLLSTSLSGIASERADDSEQPSKRREFRLDYGATLEGLPVNSRVRVWSPVPQSSADQTILLVEYNLPAGYRMTTEPIHGNEMLYIESQVPGSGQLNFKVSYLVARNEVRGLSQKKNQQEPLSDQQRKLYLAANRLVPTAGKPLHLLDGTLFTDDPLETARALYDRVDQHVRYDKSLPGYGQGDVLWVCDSRQGNCTDFHSLFISLCRAKGIPARFEIGFPLPPERGEGTINGYHCWAWFHHNPSGWVPVDISEADKHPELKEYYFGNLTENRVTLTTGRDINLVPRQDGQPLNYFIYPYVEVDGKPWPAEKVKAQIQYRDQ